MGYMAQLDNQKLVNYSKSYVPNSTPWSRELPAVSSCFSLMFINNLTND